MNQTETETTPSSEASTQETEGNSKTEDRPREIGGPKGPEPTRYGDWERNGRCSDF